jgi:hypothetical protein
MSGYTAHNCVLHLSRGATLSYFILGNRLILGVNYLVSGFLKLRIIN